MTSESGLELLQSWSWKDLSQILCAEMGEERGYVGRSKCEMIEQLLKVVPSTESMQLMTKPTSLLQSTITNTQKISRRQRKGEHPLRLPASIEVALSLNGKNLDNTQICKNSACRAILSLEDMFCKQCSCYICHLFDSDKDPSLWLACSSDPFSGGDSCGLSCHLECALKHQRAGVVNDGHLMRLDGSYCCASCGKVTGLLRCWRKQLIIAKDAQTVDILCYRILLSLMLFTGTNRYRDLHEIVVKAARQLEEEVGPLNGVSAKMSCCIVSRLSTGIEVQKLCALAVEKAEASLSRMYLSGNDAPITEALCPDTFSINFEDTSSTSLVLVLKEIDSKLSQDVVGYKLWHRKTRDSSYLMDPSCILSRNEKKALFSDLQPCTEYTFKIVLLTNRGEVAHCEAKCFTKNAEVICKTIESSTLTGVLVTCDSLSSENFSSTSVKYDVIPNHCDSTSNFNVQDLGKILNADLAHDHGPNVAFECPAENQSGNQVEAGFSSKPFGFIVPDLNVNLTPSSEASIDEVKDFDSLQVAESEDAHGDSVCALHEQKGMLEIDSEKISQVLGGSQQDSANSKDNQTIEPPKGHGNHSKVTVLKETGTDNELDMPTQNGMEVVPFDCFRHEFPFSTCKLDNSVNGIIGHSQRKSNRDFLNWAMQPTKEAPAIEPQIGVSRKRALSRHHDANDYDRNLVNGIQIPSPDSPSYTEKSYEYCIKIARWLECEGHFMKEFRMKFLTWFSLRATLTERRIVQVYIDTLLDDPASLAGQLVDTFSEIISSKRPLVMHRGFCSKLWH